MISDQVPHDHTACMTVSYSLHQVRDLVADDLVAVVGGVDSVCKRPDPERHAAGVHVLGASPNAIVHDAIAEAEEGEFDSCRPHASDRPDIVASDEVVPACDFEHQVIVQAQRVCIVLNVEDIVYEGRLDYRRDVDPMAWRLRAPDDNVVVEVEARDVVTCRDAAPEPLHTHVIDFHMLYVGEVEIDAVEIGERL